ncbi:MotA/TolQ/ExbB proton channel family protein [Pseudoalteromonas umbrosa]|uniref:MotA/TolQ/ExbB proton channel family protein n=1 Tax=Pseudoalteromonas umbrosa TaxID=3048489 RepID=UPI0024C353C7|nr:MotA/TolQ/ExbB proton channel family protein [Pseudoalteromonas sp. B95]MDK1286103.1 MotA/TolQ/ExbB proton channel family protein [Pseudoalteromonas sp. B95]
MIRATILTLLLAASFTSIGASIESSVLLQRISESTEKLNQTQKKIDEEHKILAKKLQAQLLKVKSLRERAKNIRRLEDEQLLNIDSLKSRNQQWLAQQNYQIQLISSFEQQTQSHITDDDSGINAETIINQFNALLTPTFSTKQLIGSDNKLKAFDSIKLGPLQFAMNDEEAGIVTEGLNNETARVAPINSSHNFHENMLVLKETGRSYIHFDPTLGNANKLSQTNTSFIEYIERGGTWAIPIISFALAALVIALLKSFQLLKLPSLKELDAKIKHYANKPLNAHDFDNLLKDLDPIQRSLILVIENNTISQKRDDLLIAELSKHKAHNEKYLGVITTCAAVAPLLGLLGTVSGMIHTFMMMNIFGSGDASVVSGGISQALITTELGLIVAIPSLIVGALLGRKVKSFQSSLESLALQLSKLEVSDARKQHE